MDLNFDFDYQGRTYNITVDNLRDWKITEIQLYGEDTCETIPQEDFQRICAELDYHNEFIDRVKELYEYELSQMPTRMYEVKGSLEYD